MRRVLYVAHPLAPTEDEIDAEDRAPDWPGVGGHTSDRAASARRCAMRNINLAMRWLAWLRASFPDDTFIAPWIATVMSLHGDDSPDLRESGLRDDCAVVERCDGIVLCGSRISSGMRREMAHGGHRVGLLRPGEPWPVFDLTRLDLLDPPAVVTGMTLDEWIDRLDDE